MRRQLEIYEKEMNITANKIKVMLVVLDNSTKLRTVVLEELERLNNVNK